VAKKQQFKKRISGRSLSYFVRYQLRLVALTIAEMGRKNRLTETDHTFYTAMSWIADIEKLATSDRKAAAASLAAGGAR
jgi:hypothetical protein